MAGCLVAWGAKATKRGEEVALKLVSYNLLDASWVAIGRKGIGYGIEIKSESYDSFREFVQGKNLIVEEDKNRGFCIIYEQ